VLLKPTLTPNAKTAHAVYAVKYGRNYILLNLTQANRVIESQLQRRYFSFLGKRKYISHEMKLGNYRTDLFIHDTNTLVEIKSILAFDKDVSFPTVYSERSVNQLKEISKLLDKGYHACYMLVSLNPKVKKITINSAVEDFYHLFYECVSKGMTYCAVSVHLVQQEPELYSRIQMIL
jgi:DNA-binding sugar fermentation-stimulating protein